MYTVYTAGEAMVLELEDRNWNRDISKGTENVEVRPMLTVEQFYQNIGTKIYTYELSIAINVHVQFDE